MISRIVDGFPAPIFFDAEAIREVFQWEPPVGTHFVVTFPKCGTTWTQMIIQLLVTHGQKPSSNALNQLIVDQPFLELTGLEGEVIDNWSATPAYKTHLPYMYQPKVNGSKFLVVFRNPKDAIVSFYFHDKMFSPVDVDFNEFFDHHVNGDAAYGDYFHHVTSWWQAIQEDRKRPDPQITYLVYEDMKRDPEGAIRTVAKFLGPDYERKLNTEKGFLENVLKYSHVQEMKKLDNIRIDAVQWRSETPPKPIAHMIEMDPELTSSDKPDNGLHFIRKGETNDWKNHLSPQQNEIIVKKFKKYSAEYGIDKIWSDLSWL